MNIAEQLKELKNIKPRKDWVDGQRELLLSQITAQTSYKPQSVFINSWFFTKSIMPVGFVKFVARPVGVMTVLVAFLFSTGMLGVNASKGSLPGDLLYSVKLTSESVQVGLTSKEEKKAELHVQFAEERVKEIVQVAKSNDINPADKKEKIQQAAEVLKQDLQQAQTHLDNANQDSNKAQDVVASAQIVDVKAQALTAQIATSKDALVTAQIGVDSKDVIKKLDEAQAASTATSVAAVGVIVDKQVSGEVKLPENELVNNIAKKIDDATATVKATTETVKTMVDDAAIKPADLNATAASGNFTQVVDSNATLQTVTEIKDKPEQATQMLNEAKQLLEQGNLSSALDKVQQSADITQGVAGKINDIVTPTVTNPVK